MQNKYLPYIALATGIIALSMSAMFVRWAEAPGTVTGFYRVLISTILLTPLFLRQQKNLEPIDKKYLYFLSTKYGRKMEYFAKNPKVSVEIEEYAPDMSVFSFVSLQGTLEEVKDPAGKKKVRQQFVEMVAQKKLSPHVLTALGHRPGDRPDVLVNEERSLVWRLVRVKDIVALKNG